METKPMHRLFIQDSESPPTIGKLLMLIVGIVVALVISDWLLGRILPFVTIEPPFILRFENIPGVVAMWRDTEAGINPVIFTGSSQVYTGISPHLFDEHVKTESGQTVHSVNISILGSAAVIQRDLIRNLFIPNHPQVIIYGVEMRALLPAAQLESPTSFVTDFKNSSLGYAVTTDSTTERILMLWLLEHSNWAGYRENLRAWLTGTREIIRGNTLPAGVDDMGFAPFANTPGQGTSNLVQFIPFGVTDSTKQLLPDIGTNCKQSDVQCILLNMPLHQIAYEYISAHEESQYRQLLQDAGLPIWDFNTEGCRTALGDRSFFNVNHLNSNGAELFSQMVADLYSKVFFNTDMTTKATCAVVSP